MPNLSCGCIDTHTHVVPHDFPAYIGKHVDARWPSMAPAQACHRHVMIQGSIYRTVADKAWDSGVRIEDMAATGIDRQVLSPMPELLSYWLAAEDGSTLCRFLNEQIAEMVRRSPDRFLGLGAVPLQDMDRAIAELEYAVQVLKLSGVEIGSNVNGVPIGHSSLKPFFEAAARLGAAVFVHAMRPAGMDRLVGPPAYEQVLAFPGEIGLSALSMITGGTLAATPDLRIAFSHGGGSLQVLVARLEQARRAMPAVRDSLPEAPRDAVRRMFFDDLLYDSVQIESLIGLVGATQVMIGTDYPFTIMDRDPVAQVAALQVDEEVKVALRGGNALRWLGLGAASPA
jgi:aminocarboxymuconate-semialdehyde decarboxylase